MKKSALLLTVISATSLLASCGTTQNEDLPFAIGIAGKLTSGETCKMSIYKDATPIDVNATYTIDVADAATIEGNTITWTNKEDVEVVIIAEFEYESTAYTCTADVHVNFYDPLEGITLTSIKDLKTNGTKGNEYYVEGIVIARRGNGSGGYDGFILKDDTDTIYVHDSTIAATASEGKKIVIKAKYDLWMVESTIETLTGLGFSGARQLTSPTLVHTYSGTFDYSFDDFEESTMYDLSTAIPGKDNISSNVYKVRAKITKDKPANYVNYYFHDPKEIGNMYTYSNHDGADYAYLEKYCDGQYRECLIMIINAHVKGPTAFYRMVPVAIGDVVTQTTQDIVDGAALMGAQSFNESYSPTDKETTLENLLTIEAHKDIKLTYSSNNNNVAFVKDNVIHLTGKVGEAKITVTAALGEFSSTQTAKIVVAEVAQVGTTPIEEIYATKHLNDVVAVKGIVASYAWKNGAGNKGVYYIADSTGSVIIEPNKDNLETELKVGEEVIIKGKYYIQGEEEPDPNSYTYFEGNRRITDVEIISHDNQTHELPIKLEEKTIPELRTLECTPETTKVGNLYMTTCKIEVNVQTYYTTIKLVDLNSTEYLSVYSGSIHDVEFLEQYNGKTVKMMVGLRDSKQGENYRIDAFETAIKIVE